MSLLFCVARGGCAAGTHGTRGGAAFVLPWGEARGEEAGGQRVGGSRRGWLFVAAMPALLAAAQGGKEGEGWGGLGRKGVHSTEATMAITTRAVVVAGGVRRWHSCEGEGRRDGG